MQKAKKRRQDKDKKQMQKKCLMNTFLVKISINVIILTTIVVS